MNKIKTIIKKIKNKKNKKNGQIDSDGKTENGVTRIIQKD